MNSVVTGADLIQIAKLCVSNVCVVIYYARHGQKFDCLFPTIAPTSACCPSICMLVLVAVICLCSVRRCPTTGKLPPVQRAGVGSLAIVKLSLVLN
jgi:hypothetical protein